VVLRRGRLGTVCARGADQAASRGRSASPLDRCHEVRCQVRPCRPRHLRRQRGSCGELSGGQFQEQGLPTHRRTYDAGGGRSRCRTTSTAEELFIGRVPRPEVSLLLRQPLGHPLRLEGRCARRLLLCGH